MKGVIPTAFLVIWETTYSLYELPRNKIGEKHIIIRFMDLLVVFLKKRLIFSIFYCKIVEK